MIQPWKPLGCVTTGGRRRERNCLSDQKHRKLSVSAVVIIIIIIIIIIIRKFQLHYLFDPSYTFIYTGDDPPAVP